jgi:hypothetical protein
MNKRTQRIGQSGSVLVNILIVLSFLTTMLFSILLLANSNLQRARGRIMLLQAQYAAESAADAAIAELNNNNATYAGTSTDVTLLTTGQYKATYSVAVASGSTAKEKILTATGKIYRPANAATPKITRKLRVTVQRSSTSTASSVLSRNIINVDSGVKDITGKNIYVNGYINMSKNSTNLIAENITVGGRNTGAGNCSIGGTGNLVKPSSFSTAGQTKTNIVLAYNNCISPPGNLSNANFNVSANQGTISPIQSTYIPWNEYLDSSYNNANNCNDWTNGTSPRTIPSAANPKKTHYPDSSSNIATTCGTSGNINLGSARYNITDHVHIRANLCATAACTPTFYNPNPGAAGIKYVFVEGTINFDGMQSVAGSGPIVFITYGADPASKASVCPLGGSIYLGNSGTTSAPAIFFLASNGLCLDKTKFGASPALGGIAGKNLYIATNAGSPHDLELDKTFPVSSIPIDLAWRAMRYQRL